MSAVSPRPRRPRSLRPESRAELRRRLEEALEQRDRARRRAERLEARLEGATREDLGYLFVVTYGRSGSTLLQGVLNSIPGYLVRGENQQLLRHLHQFHRVGTEQRRKRRASRRRRGLPASGTVPANPWFGMEDFRGRAALVGARRLALETLLRPEPDTRVVGFKEIRWSRPDVASYVAWLREVFPGARFVVNTRNLDDVAQSRWWAEDPDSRDELAEVESRLLALVDELGEAAFHVHYDDYVADPAALRPLFDWLGEEWDEEQVRSVLEVRHSY
jgi:hypothetical protein